MKGIVILGAGPMGTTLAKVLAAAGKRVTLWCPEPETIRASLPSVELTSDLGEATARGRLVLAAVGSQTMSATAAALRPHVGDRHLLVSATKGFDLPSLKTMSGVLASATSPAAVGALSGPNMMADLLAGQPTGIVVATSAPDITAEVAEIVACEQLFVYANDDLLGVELAGALKNVVVVAVGIAAGLGYTANVCSWIVARAIAEMTTLAVALGARRETFGGLAGLADVYLTCTSPDSVNRKVGVELGKGRRLEEAFPDPRSYPECVFTLRACRRLIEQAGLELPIAHTAATILEGEVPPSRMMTAVARFAAHDVDRDPRLSRDSLATFSTAGPGVD
jgi:glycerol-3-phosphate dehydrogenase (NAD(P)+)